jgi:lipopolysaccharide/colanic/teichoic acid biosynthesis glycosyltransferase
MFSIKSLFLRSPGAHNPSPVGQVLASPTSTFDAEPQRLLARQKNQHQAVPVFRDAGDITKRTFDAVCALAILVMVSPLLAAIALLVMRDGGACVFGHTRIGRNGIKFKCLKFRSMVVNADAVLKDLLERDPVARAEWERDFKLKNDIRITSLDELPQLWNVVRGEMSLVGPRPIVEAELQRYGKYASCYLMTKPGITGLWQVSGRSDIDYTSRVSLDVLYAMNQSFAGDVGILFKTIGVVLHGRGAY